MAAVPRDPCRSFSPDVRLFRCDAGRRCAGFETGYATRSVCRLLEEVSSRAMRGAAANRGASYRDSQLFIAFACRLLAVGAVHLQLFPESPPKGFEQLVPRAFLAIHPRTSFIPALPPPPPLLPP